MAWSLFAKRDGDATPKAPPLLPLTPEYKEHQHGVYFAAIEEALTGPNRASIRNIALTGSYGVGKSSILLKVAREHKSAAFISLSSLGFVDGDERPNDGIARIASTKTNRIQQEIVKQLLYGQDPVKMPGSRYRRITRFRFWREFGLASLLAVPLTLAFHIAGWSEILAKLARVPEGFEDLALVPIWLLTALFVVGVRKVLHNRIHIEKITAGEATIALSSQSATFFDEYLDEIVYFFERTSTDVLVFEDIDRFDDAHIFETLRSLNTLLNGAKQLGGRNIRFIYAIKDSIFDELGARAAAEELSGESEPSRRDDAAEAEIARANRTKFFDLVVPVVPFVTHRSARDLLKATLADLDHQVSDELVDLAARHVADMRLIKNVRNEFAIFRERIIVQGSLDLRDDALLAMILYKSTHMSDFELIKIGKSNLDTLYGEGRAMINENIARVAKDVRSARRVRGQLKPAEIRSEEFGGLLESYIQRYLDHTGVALQSAQIANESITVADFRTASFWEKVASGNDLVIGYTVRPPGYGGTSVNATFTKAQIAEVLNDSINTSEWESSRRAQLDQEIEDGVALQDFLQHADMRDLAARGDLEHEGKTFGQLIDDLLESELARQLVKGGYIDRNYTLYTSTFYAERVSAEATNFILKNVDPNVMDMNFELSEADVAAVLRERGPGLLSERAAYNVSVLDYLLADADPSGANKLLDKITAYGPDEREVLAAYIERGRNVDELVRRLAGVWPHVFLFLVDDIALEAAERMRLLDVALGSVSSGVAYETNDSIRDLFNESYAAFKTLTSKRTPAAVAEVAAHVVRGSGAIIESLAPIAGPVRAALVKAGAYAVNRGNIVAATGSEDIALDTLAKDHNGVYRRVLGDLTAYIAALKPRELTIRGEHGFNDVVGAVVVAASDEVLEVVVRRSSKDAVARRLISVATEAWPVLARCHKFPATLENVQQYLIEFEMDPDLGSHLAYVKKIDVTGAESEEALKKELALKIIAARAFIPSPKIRSGLVESMDLPEFIDVDEIQSEAGELFGRLIGDQVIEDAPESFAAIERNDWPGRQYAISRSQNFATFVEPELLPVQDVGLFFRSARVPLESKQAVLARLPEFVVGASQATLVQVADALIGDPKLTPTAGAVAALAGYVGNLRVLALLEPLLPTLDLATLQPILESVGGDIAKLAGSTGKRPRLAKYDALMALVGRLDELGQVASIEDEGATVRVIMRRP